MESNEVLTHLSNVLAIITPQVTIIFTFLFRDANNLQQAQIEQNKTLFYMALSFSLIYHLSFWFFLWFGLIEEKMGATMKQNTDSLIRFMGLISIFGMSPVGFLFSSKIKKGERAKKAAITHARKPSDLSSEG